MHVYMCGNLGPCRITVSSFFGMVATGVVDMIIMFGVCALSQLDRM